MQYPIEIKEIPISESSLQSAICWKNLKRDTVYLFNSSDELIPFLCDDYDISELKLDKHSLTIAYGVCTHGIVEQNQNLQQISENKYKLTVDNRLGMTTDIGLWYVSTLTKKIPQNRIITFNKVKHF